MCALDSDGAAYRWGDGISGRLGDGTFTSRTRQIAVYTGGALSGAKVTQVATSTQTWMLTQQG